MKLPFINKTLALPPLNSLLPLVAGLLIVGAFLIAGLLLIVPNVDPETPPKGAVTAVSVNGFKGLREVMEARGQETRLNRKATGRREATDDLMIVTLDGDMGLYNPLPDESGNYDAPNPEKSRQILYAPLGKAVLVVAPKWQTPLADPRKPRWAAPGRIVTPAEIQSQLALLTPVSATTHEQDDETVQTLRYKDIDYDIVSANRSAAYAISPAPGQDIVRTGFASGRITGLQSISGPNLTPLLVGPGGEVLLSKVNPTGDDKPFAAPVYLLSDPDLLNNHALAQPERLAAMLRVLEQLAGKPKPSVVFDITFNDLASDSSLLHHISRPPFVGVPLALMALALALVWAAAARFGPPVDPIAEAPHGRGVRILADNAARLVAKAGRETKLMPTWAQNVRDQVLAHEGFTPNTLMSADEMADRLSERHNTDEFYGNLFTEATTVSSIGPALALARRLNHWKTQIIKTENRGHAGF